MTSHVSVVLATYGGDNPDALRDALDSVLCQTHMPSEIVFVENGPIPSTIESVVETYQQRYPDIFSIIRIDTNQERGYARRIGVENASHELVAMMDSDDIAVSQRFEEQVEYFSDHPETDAVGGYIAEFTDDPDDPHAIRRVPLTPEEVADKARFRSPINQMTVMARRKAILEAGNYQRVDPMEDYDLWARMLVNGSKLANIPQVLAKVRGGEEMYARRGGWKNAYQEIRLQRQFLESGFINMPVALINLGIRIPIRLLPNRLRGMIYSRILRD
jgi:glycosyltransferase involved in cell wall biosynthesis